LYSHLVTDERAATQRKIIAYPANFNLVQVFSLFSVTLTGPCTETGYLADRKAIPAVPDLHKYVIAVDGTVYIDFGFDFLPLSFNYFKVYQLSVVTYPGNVNVASFPWLSVDEGQGAPSAKLKVDTNTPAHEAYYTVTVKSHLYSTSAFLPEFKFKIYLHVSPCLRSVLSFGSNFP